MSSISSECIRTSRPTRTSRPVRPLTIVSPFLQLSLVDANVGQLAEASFLQLERESDERRVEVGAELDFLFALGNIERFVDHLGRTRKVARHRVEQRLHRLVLVCRTEKDRRQIEGDRSLADRLMDQFGSDPVLENRLHELVGIHRDGVEHLRALLFRLLAKRLGNFLHAPDIPIGTVEIVRLHFDEIDDAFVVGFEADRNLHHDGVVLELLAQLCGDAKRVRAGPVGLVDEGEPRDVVAAHLPVDGHRLRLHAGDRAQHQNRAVENPQRPFDLDREVHVARSVDDVDEVVVPLAVSRGGLDRNAALPLQVHGIHLRPDAILPLDVVDDADALRVEKNSLGQCRFTGIDMRADPDVSYPL